MVCVTINTESPVKSILSRFVVRLKRHRISRRISFARKRSIAMYEQGTT